MKRKRQELEEDVAQYTTSSFHHLNSKNQIDKKNNDKIIYKNQITSKTVNHKI